MDIIRTAEEELSPLFREIDNIALFNQDKVLNAFRKNRIALRHFAPSTGYGYGDDARDTLNSLFSDIFKAEKSVVSPNIVSGTHALSIGLFALLRPNDKLLFISGKPYDTLNDVISGENIGSLKDYQISYENIELTSLGKFDFPAIEKSIRREMPKLVMLQRSRGYDIRNALSIEEIKEVCSFLRSIGYNNCIYVDNCYGEFTSKEEPLEVGADLIAGSLIKNPCGGLAQTGGYLAGKEKYMKLVENRLTAPSIGGEVGSYASTYQYFYQGLFIAPSTVKDALQGSLLVGAVLNKYGFSTSPSIDELPRDIIRSVKFDTEEQLVAFIQAVQYSSPVDSFVELLPWDMPGYDHQVIMAAGCFVQGSSIELSADAPIKKPYIAYFQGGITYEHIVIALGEILKRLNKT